MWPVKTDCPAWAPPLLAVQFLTRLPVPGLSRLSHDAVRTGLGRAVGWFPLVGALVGALSAGIVILTGQWWPRTVAVILALIIEAGLTGAFHEDALGDFCDGVGGGRDPLHARGIMKDSRIGSYGALGLTLGVGLRAALMIALPAASLALAIIASATFGRLLAVFAMSIIPPAPRANGLSLDVTADLRGRDVALASLTAIPGLIGLAILAPLALMAACLASALFMAWLRALVIRRIGGSTGDCLGFVAFAGQLIVLLAASAQFSA